ncbi:MAG: hypothetical protein JWR24_4327 [Actinoallomurus sp.]|nr:hypothetical protein [Actinoallomurus sp.]
MRPRPYLRRKAVVTGVVVAAVAALGAVSVMALSLADGASSRPVGPSPSPRAARVVPPPANATFDYQIGASYAPARGVRVLSRDRSGEPAAGLYNICYVNAFQAQPDELNWWKKTHPELLLRGAGGAVIVDQDWNEALLDVSTPARRAEIASIVGTWIDGCAHRGFQAVEPDNLDSYERSGGRLTLSDNASFARLLARRAHAAGLAIAQKNTTDLLAQHNSIGFDFAVTEECGRYGECGQYASAYANRVFDIEYSAGDFAATCRGSGAALSVVLRDRDVSEPGSPDYRFKTC